MSMIVRESINIGSTFMKGDKKCVVIGVWYEVGGCSMAVEYVKANDDYGYTFPLRLSKVIYDEDIEKLEIIKY